MNWYSIFYWLTVADGVKRFLDTASDIFTFFAILTFVILVITMIGKAIQTSSNDVKNDEEEKKDSALRGWNLARSFSAKLFYPFLILAIITWLGYVMVPSKKDCLLIVAGGAVGNFITSDTSARQLPADVTKFLHMSLKKEISELNDDARRELGVQTPKERLIDKAKQMTKEELISYLQSDTTIAKE